MPTFKLAFPISVQEVLEKPDLNVVWSVFQPEQKVEITVKAKDLSAAVKKLSQVLERLCKPDEYPFK
jgi:hypothetical protein